MDYFILIFRFVPSDFQKVYEAVTGFNNLFAMLSSGCIR